MGNNIMGSKLLELLSGIDKNKLEEASRVLNSMSKDDLNSIVSMLKNGSNNQNGK
ncbi:MAG: hypothetical protein IJ809_00825 [Clostridia bacterium]|nr:hypothetical protein [Clostridia bacterium]